MEFLDTLAKHPALFIGSCTVLGLLIGSFLNVVIYRLPVMMDNAMRAECAELAAADALGKDSVAAEAGTPEAAVVETATGVAPPTPEAVMTAPELGPEVPPEVVAPPADEPAAPASPEPAPPAPASRPAFNLVVPRSACPNCHAPITALQNVPVVSWLVLGGRCASCRTPISARYPLVELLTGVASGLVAWRLGFGLTALAGLFFTWTLIALTFIDLDTFLLPDSLTLPLTWMGLLLSLFEPVWAPGVAPLTPADSIVGAAVGYLSLWSFYWLFLLIRKREGMGYGDFKLFAAFGAWFGWQMLLPIILFASLVGSLFGVWVLYRQHKGLDAHIPFGPYLALAGWLFLMIGHDVVARWFAFAGTVG
ncbi:MAG TPA: A24 family peptidase [Steroidobacteraceae bacterium]|nr:A24 family peptidase [Steroidobacteraceae bacterium]